MHALGDESDDMTSFHIRVTLSLAKVFVVFDCGFSKLTILVATTGLATVNNTCILPYVALVVCHLQGEHGWSNLIAPFLRLAVSEQLGTDTNCHFGSCSSVLLPRALIDQSV